jgi:CBS-domain-containing membrane protein
LLIFRKNCSLYYSFAFPKKFFSQKFLENYRVLFAMQSPKREAKLSLFKSHTSTPDSRQGLERSFRKRSAKRLRFHIRTKRYIQKMRGGSARPAPLHYSYIFWSWLGAFLGIAATGYPATLTHAPLLIAPFGATCVLIFGAPDSPLAQPRNVIGGHCITTVISLTLLHLFGADWWVMALAVATGIGVMQLTSTLHPPAGATPLVVIMTKASWSFFFTPVLTGALVLVGCAVLFNNLARERSYPKYWF